MDRIGSDRIGSGQRLREHADGRGHSKVAVLYDDIAAQNRRFHTALQRRALWNGRHITVHANE
jgi:hypothetical protein